MLCYVIQLTSLGLFSGRLHQVYTTLTFYPKLQSWTKLLLIIKSVQILGICTTRSYYRKESAAVTHKLDANSQPNKSTLLKLLIK